MSQGPEPGPLTPEQQEEVAQARKRAQAIARAGKTATFNGWTIGVFAAITLLFGLGSLTALILGVGMAVVARTEFRGRALLRAFDPDGPRLLAKNQMGFMGLIIAYCLWSIGRTLYGPGPDLAGLEAMLGDLEDLLTTLIVLVYLIVIVATAVFQGLMVRFYRKRVRMVEEYVRDTPDWIMEIQRNLG